MAEIERKVTLATLENGERVVASFTARDSKAD